MALKIEPTAVHEITRANLVTPVHLTAFADKIVACCLENRELFLLANVCLNYDAIAAKYDRNDFMDPVTGLIFAGMQAFNQTYVNGNPWPHNRVSWAQAIAPHYDHFFQKNPDFPPSYKALAVKKIIGLPFPIPGDPDRVCDGLVDYVTGVRYHQLELLSRGYDPNKRRLALADVPRSIQVPGLEAEATSHEDMLYSIFSAPDATRPFYTGVAKFDSYYGTRAVGGDAWIAGGHPGGGKTNLACQSAGFTASHGKRVMFITTEVKSPVIMMRACSAVTEVPYAALRGLLGGGASTPRAVDFAKWVREGPGKNIDVYDYRTIAGHSFDEKLDRMLDSYVRKNGGFPDFAILDWVGKAIDTAFPDAWQKREGYSRVGIRMADLADAIGGNTLTLAQANPDTKNKTNMSDMDMADCRALSQPFEGAIMITSLLDLQEGTAGDKEVHKDHQYLIIPKCREEMTLRLPVLRQFQYAKFVDT